MKKLSFVFVLGLLVTSTVTYSEGFTLKSADVAGQLSSKQVFNGWGCEGENVSPQLSWENAPEGTQSFAVTAYDPDAPTGSGWWHWLIFDIPANIQTLDQNAGQIEAAIAPEGSVQSMTSTGEAGYAGACPPEGDGPHQYIFTIYALKTEKLGPDANTTPSIVGFNLGNNMLAKSSISAYYGR